MRYQGKISAWNADRGFGFIVCNGGGGGEKIFVHISQFSHKKYIPEIGDVVTYELGPKDEKGQKAVNVIFPHLAPLQKKAGWKQKKDDHSFGLSGIVFLLLIGAGLYWWFGIRQTGSGWVMPSQQAGALTQTGKSAAETSRFSCQGKTHCSQMTSCEEATYYIQHCPNTEMDGNGDGVPCESQWCN